MARRDQIPKGETVLAKDIKFKGVLRFKKSLRINGHLEGEIQAEEGSLIIGDQAEVKAKVSINQLYNYGKMIGNVQAKHSVSIFSEAEVTGDIATKGLIIDPGGFFNGQCNMTRLANNNNDTKKQQSQENNSSTK